VWTILNLSLWNNHPDTTELTAVHKATGNACAKEADVGSRRRVR
jgi:hypothetical protein